MTSDYKNFIDASSSVGELFHCSRCNMTCSSQKMLDEHNCGNSSFDIQKVKTEVCDEVIAMCTADSSENTSHPLTVGGSLLNPVKKEIKEEPKVIHKALEKTKKSQCRRGKKKTYVQTSVNIAPKLKPAVNTIDPAVASLKLASQSERKNALLKPKNYVRESNIRIEQVFYTDPNQHQNGEIHIPFNPAVVSQNLTLTGTTICDKFSSLPTNMLSNTNILSNTVVPNSQQNSILLGSLNSVQTINSLQPANMIQGLQNINFVPAIQGLQSINLNQNAPLTLHQTHTQDVNQSRHEPVVGIQASPSFPILIGNQIFMVDAATFQTINSSPVGSMQPPVMFTSSPAVSSLNQTSNGSDKSMSMEKESNFFTEKFRYKIAEKRKRTDKDVSTLASASDNLLVHDTNSKLNNRMKAGVSNNLPIHNEATKTITKKSSKLTSTSNFTTNNLVTQTEQKFNSPDLLIPSNVSQSPMNSPLVQQTSFIIPHQQNANFIPNPYPFPGNFLNLINNPGLIMSNANNDLQRPASDHSRPIQNIKNSHCSTTGNIEIVSSVSTGNPFSMQPRLSSSQATTLKTAFVSISPKVVPATAKNNEEPASGIVVSRILPKALKSCTLGYKESLKIQEETSATVCNLSKRTNSRKSVTKLGPNSSKARSAICIKQSTKKLDMQMLIKPLDKSSKTSENLNLQSVGDKMNLPTLTGLQPHLQNLFDKEFGGDTPGQNGRVLVGPLTKTELDKIIRNPAELKNYVNIPTDQVVIASKALAVTANMSKSFNTFDTNSKLLQVLPNDKGLPIKIVGTYSKFIQVLPKTDKTMLVTSAKPSENIPFNYKTTNDPSQAEQNQVSIPVSESTTHISKSSDPKKLAPKRNLSAGFEDTKKKEIMIMPKKDSEIAIINIDSSQTKIYPTYELSDVKQDPSNGSMRLAFEGDINLLKDSLRRTTVPLHKLSCGPNDIVKIKLPSVPVHSNVKHTINRHQTVTILDQNIPKKRKLLHNNHPTQKQWIPTKVISDLKMNVQIVEGPTQNILKDNGIRKSSRVSGKPTFKYIDNEISLSDDGAELEKAEIKSCKSAKEEYETQEHVTNTNITNTISLPVEDLNESDTQYFFHSNESRPSENTSNVSEDIILESMLKQEQMLTVSLSRDQNETEALTIYSSETQESNKIKNEHAESCYNSSESDSDMFDLDTDMPCKSERKKLMLKHHNEVTMFLIKNSSKFYSKEENEHYCNICNRYKTNGIFNLSKHLKKHLQGLLKCCKCSFEAWNEDALTQHQVKYH